MTVLRLVTWRRAGQVAVSCGVLPCVQSQLCLLVPDLHARPHLETSLAANGRCMASNAEGRHAAGSKWHAILASAFCVAWIDLLFYFIYFYFILGERRGVTRALVGSLHHAHAVRGRRMGWSTRRTLSAAC